MKKDFLWPFLLIIVLLWIPLSQQIFQFVRVYPLSGVYEQHEKPEMASVAWFEKDFQRQFEDYQNQQFGFRNLFVRFRNELEWGLFKKVNAHRVVAGKDDFLFERSYLHSYLGTDYIGDSAIAAKAKALSSAHQYFQDKGLPIITVIGPGKAWYYPELIPSHLHPRKKEKTNYQQFISELESQNIPFIDFNRVFMDASDSLGVLYYPKTGIHWSSFGAAMALDSVVNYVRQAYGLTIPDYRIENMDNFKTRVGSGDNDLEKLMNLLIDMPNDPMVYPSYLADSLASKPRLLVIGDSFFYLSWPYAEELFEFDYYYYYRRVQSSSEREFKKNFDLWIEEYDLIILLGTEAGLTTFPWGFLEDVDSAANDSSFPIIDESVSIK